MGSPGMRASLVNREVITDSIELVARGNLFDAAVILVGCDKTIPGGIAAASISDRRRYGPAWTFAANVISSGITKEKPENGESLLTHYG